MPHVSYSRLALLACVVCGVFFIELGAARLWDRDEPRNARASHEMLARGDWIVPTFNGSLRDHKPVLLYWAQMLSYVAMGESEFTARLPSAVCALLTVAALAILASRISGKSRGISQEGFWAAGAMATCLLFVMAGRAATPDACLIAFSTMGIAALVLSALAPCAPFSSGHVGRARWGSAMLGYALLGVAALAKGPVGIILPLIVVHAWWLICLRFQAEKPVGTQVAPNSPLQRMRSLLYYVWQVFNPLQCLRAAWALKTIPGLLLSMLVAAPWYVAVGLETDGEFLRGFFLNHNLGRALGTMEGHDGSLLFYPAAFVVGTFPWSLWLIPIVMWCRTAARESVVQRQLVVLSAVWIAVYVLAFSAAGTKLPSYITPCYAGAALALGGFWRQFEDAWSRPTIRLRRLAYGLTIGVGMAVTTGILWLSNHEAMPLLARASVAGVVIALVGGLGFAWELKSKTQWVPLTWLVGAAAFQILLFGFGAKSVDAYRTDLAIFSPRPQTDATRPWLAIGGLEPSWVHYLGQEIIEVTDHESKPRAWEQVAAFLARFPLGRVIVVGESAHENLARWQADSVKSFPLVEIAKAPRFLRPGSIRVFEQHQLTPHDNSPPATTTSHLAEHERGLDESISSDAIPNHASLPQIPSLEDALPPPAEYRNAMRDPAARTATKAEYPNPLRLK